MHKAKWAAILGLGSIGLAGCGAEAFFDTPLGGLLPETVEYQQIVGGDDASLIFARAILPLTNDAPTELTTAFVRVDRATLTASDLGEVTYGDQFGAITDGTWVAWTGAGLSIGVLDVGTGETFSYPRPTARLARPVGFADDRLVVEYDADGGTGLWLIDLLSGDGAVLVEPVAGVRAENAVVAGDSVIWFVYDPLRPKVPTDDPPVIVPVEATSIVGRIERVEIATGAVTTLVDDLIPPEYAGFALDGTRLGWGGRSNDFATMQLETLDLTNDTRAVVATFVDEERSFHEIFDLGPTGVLLHKTMTPPSPTSLGDLLGASALVETWYVGWDGTMQRLLEEQRALVRGEFDLTPPQLVGDLAIVRDVTRGEYILHDLTTGEERRVRPFE